MNQPIIKQCSCERTFTQASWNALVLAGTLETEDDAGQPTTLELRHCVCGSTIAIEFPIPESSPSRVLPTPE